ncbi:MAG: ecotin family protein [Cyanobium sp.]
MAPVPPTTPVPIRPGRGLARWVPLALAGLLGPGALPSPAAQPPDLSPYPPAAPGERRWVISVPTTPAAAEDLRVELVVGRTLQVDCNRHFLQGTVAEESVPGWGYPLYRVKGGGPVVSTRMACPDQARRKEFVRLAGSPTLVPVNARLPIVVVAPADLEVRWRLWRAEPRQRPARPF